MHSCIATLLSLFATLSSARAFLSANALQNHTPRSSQAPVATCLTRYKSYYESAYQTIFFNHPDEPHFNLTILTQYTQFYPHTLEAWLLERGFTVFNATSLADDDLCGWVDWGSVEIQGRRHGQLGWKRVRSYTGNSTSGVAYTPHDAPIKPGRATLDDVVAILIDNTPHADVYYARCFMLQVGLGLLGACFAYCVLASFAIHRQRKKEQKASQGAEGVELEHIKVHDLSGSGGMQRMENDGTAGPGFDIEIAKASPSSNSSRLSGPPPVYTVDGAGRSAVSVRDMV